MSHEAIGNVRPRGAIGRFDTKWMTVPGPDVKDAIRAFNDLGYETAGVRVVDQTEATRIAEIIGRQA